jgi:hypothetical protein
MVGEWRQIGKQALFMAGIGALLGGGRGALAGAQGAQGALSARFDADAQNRNAQYQNDTNRVRFQQGQDADYNQQALGQWRADLSDFNNEENRNLRETLGNENAAMRKYIAELNADTRVATTDANIGSRERVAGANIDSRERVAGANIGSREKIADERLPATNLKAQATAKLAGIQGENILADNTRDDARLALEKRRAEATVRHNLWVERNTTLRDNIRAERDRLKATAGKPLLTHLQSESLKKQLAKASQEIAKIRNGAGDAPIEGEDPEVVRQYNERKAEAEYSAKELRDYYNERAKEVGMRFDGRGYSPIPTKEQAYKEAQARRAKEESLRKDAEVAAIVLSGPAGVKKPATPPPSLPQVNQRLKTFSPTHAPQRSTPAPQRATPRPATPAPKRSTPKPVNQMTQAEKLAEAADLIAQIAKKKKGN